MAARAAAIPPDRQLDRPNTDVRRGMSYDTDRLRRYLEANIDRLVPDQNRAYDVIIDAVEHERGGFFIDAPGGTGKTFLLSLILASLRG